MLTEQVFQKHILGQRQKCVFIWCFQETLEAENLLTENTEVRMKNILICIHCYSQNDSICVYYLSIKYLWSPSSTQAYQKETEAFAPTSLRLNCGIVIFCVAFFISKIPKITLNPYGYCMECNNKDETPWTTMLGNSIMLNRWLPLLRPPAISLYNRLCANNKGGWLAPSLEHRPISFPVTTVHVVSSNDIDKKHCLFFICPSINATSTQT